MKNYQLLKSLHDEINDYFLIPLFFISTASFGQKYSKEETKHLKTYYFNEGFGQPATRKVSTIIMKDGTERTGYCKGIRIKKGQIHTISFADEKTGEKEKIAEAYLFGSGLDKFNKVSDHIARAGTGKRNDLRKATTNDEIYFVNKTVSLKNKKDKREFLMQLLNPEFDDYISVYYDPFANETGGVSVGVMGMSGPTIGGGSIKSFYVEKGDRIFWLKKSDFKKEYENLFGDNKAFMEKYPVKSVKWNWLSALILEYTKMSLNEES